MTCTHSKETHCDCAQQTHNIGDHINGEKSNTTRTTGRRENTKIVFIGDILGNKIESFEIIAIIQNGINELLQKTNNNLKTIKINSSIHVRDYDALTIRIIGFTA